MARSACNGHASSRARVIPSTSRRPRARVCHAATALPEAASEVGGGSPINECVDSDPALVQDNREFRAAADVCGECGGPLYRRARKPRPQAAPPIADYRISCESRATSRSAMTATRSASFCFAVPHAAAISTPAAASTASPRAMVKARALSARVERAKPSAQLRHALCAARMTWSRR